MNCFLFVHFIGEQFNGEQIYFSVSKDGKNFYDLNEGLPVLKNTIGEKGARDPFVIRHPKTGKYYLIATDLRIEKGFGWQAAKENGSKNIIVWESEDLIYWEGPTALDIDIPMATNVWAPEAVFDEKAEKILVFWASSVAGKHRIYAAYTDDFSSLGTPFVFMEKSKDVIDTTVISHNDQYFRLSKDETNSRIIMEKSDELLGPYKKVPSPILESFSAQIARTNLPLLKNSENRMLSVI